MDHLKLILSQIKPVAYLTKQNRGKLKVYTTPGRAKTSSYSASEPEPIYTEAQMIEFAEKYHEEMTTK